MKGRDGVIRGAKLKTVNGVRERPLQLLYPMELYVSKNTDKKVLKQLIRKLKSSNREKKEQQKQTLKRDLNN